MEFTIIGLFILKILASVEARKSPPEGKCHYTTVFKMLGADCSGINLINIPSSTRKLEVLDASVNRIRMLKNNSFVTYTSLRFLYLNDNSITIIEPGTFAPLEYLEVLDLSLNAIRDLPAALPYTLRKLYISENPLVSLPLGEAVSLQYLNLSDCLLVELPHIGELPNLQEINLSNNPLTNITVAQIASFCHLEVLHISSDLLDSKYTSSCDCLRVQRWTVQHSIIVHPYINCTIPDNGKDCVSNSTDETRAFSACQLALQQQSASHWAVMAVGIGFIIVCAVLLTIVWRRRRSQQPQPHRTPDQEAAFRKRKLLEETPKSKF